MRVMVSRKLSGTTWQRVSLVGVSLALIAATQLTGASKAPLKNLKFDPQAEQVELFTGLESEQLRVRVVAQDATGGNLFIENKTNQPLTVVMPEAFVGVHVLKQFNPNGFGNPGIGVQGNLGNVNFGNQTGAGGGQAGGNQSFGGGSGQGIGNQGNFNGNGNGNGFGQNLFSIPPERTAQVAYVSVCLNHGKPDPAPRLNYRLVPVEKYTDNTVLHEVLKQLAAGKVQQRAAQAAAWHLTDGMSREELAAKSVPRVPGVTAFSDPYFTNGQLQAAQELLVYSAEQAQKKQVQQGTEQRVIAPAVQSPGNRVSAR